MSLNQPVERIARAGISQIGRFTRQDLDFSSPQTGDAMKNAVAAARKPTVPNSGKSIAVPMLDLSRQYASIQPEITAVVQQVCASQQYILGPEVAKFEQEAATFLGATHGIACASGTDAIWLSLVAAGVGPGHEV